MMKFQDWLVLSEDNPFAAQQHQGRLIGQLFGWDSHGDPKTFGGRMSNWWQGGLHRKAQEMGVRIMGLRGKPNAAQQAIAWAKADGVYEHSAFAHCLDVITSFANTFNRGAGGLSGNSKFLDFFLWNILAKCHHNMRLEYNYIKELYHLVMGTEPAAEPHLIDLWEPDGDPKTFFHPKVVAGGISPMRNPAEYRGNAAEGMYGRLLTSGIISPYTLLLSLINSVPDKTLTFPANIKGEIWEQSMDFARAYFPDHMHRKRKGGGGGGSLPPAPTNTVNGLVANLQAINSGGGFTDAEKGKNQKRDVLDALTKVLGIVVTPDPTSPIGKLVDHSFYNMQAIVEQSKLR